MKRLVLSSVVASVAVLAASHAHAWDSLSYGEAEEGCMMGNRRACVVLEQYLRSEGDYYEGRSGSPADQWVTPDELRQERPGVFSPGELAR